MGEQPAGRKPVAQIVITLFDDGLCHTAAPVVAIPTPDQVPHLNGNRIKGKF